jgi:GYF domain 2
MMRDEWFCSGPEGRYGPLTLGELKDALARHPHADDVFIWHESFPNWVRAGELDLFQPAEPAPRAWNPDALVDRGGRYSDHGHYEEEDHHPPVRRRFSLLGMLVGFLLIGLGCLVFYFGMFGEIARVTDFLQIDNGELDGYAGMVFFFAGLVIIWATRYRV